MVDYRTPGGPRQQYFDALYRMNLQHGVMPGLVYLYMPALKHAKGWDEEDCLWFAFINGMTQNPLTSLRIMDELGQPPVTRDHLAHFGEWFNMEWPRLQFDTDRRYAKKDTVAAIKSYCKELYYGAPDQTEPQVYLFDADGGEWDNLWEMVTSKFVSFGRLSAFSYLEYVRIFGHGLECADLMFEDKSGSRSHRNGMLFLMDQDDLVDDKRTGRPPVTYNEFGKMCKWLAKRSDDWLAAFGSALPHAGYFTFESQLCQFKNSFFGRRYPGVYADMAWERLQWYEKNVGRDHNWKLIMEIRQALPAWLRMESENNSLTLKQRAAMFPATGVPYRAEHFLA